MFSSYRFFLIILFIFVFLPTLAKERIPTFLEGTWEIENEGLISYEHWDILSDSLMKGVTYQVTNKSLKVIEYLTICYKINQCMMSALVIDQNNSIEIEFPLLSNSNKWVFQNLEHDFPKQIEYDFLNNRLVRVTISDAKTNEITYLMRKISNNILNDTTINNPNYDEELAKKLNADDYGMKGYFLIILKSGTNKSTDKSIINKAFKGHLENITKLVAQKQLVVAGPLQKNDKNYRGIFILNVSSKEDAEKILQTDPAVKEKFLEYEIYNWYGSAALTEYLEDADKIWKKKP